jgi:iron(III) transport system ATP-binding protein
MTQPVIMSVEGVTKQFPQSTTPAVANVRLQLHQGDLLTLLGPSGCGKTTLLRLIAGFERPQIGNIIIAEQQVAGIGAWIPPELRDVGMVFQDYALFPHLSASQNIAFGLRKQRDRHGMKPNLSSSAIKKLVSEAIALVGLEGLEKRYPHELSGGQQQRVALARALAPQPALILLDEPLSNLDAQIRMRLRQELRDILKAAGTTAIFVTHDQEEALAISDWIAVMRDGKIEQFGKPEEVYNQPISRFVAEFVVQANFLPAQYHDRVWETELGCFALDQALDESMSDRPTNGSNQAVLMIRQEDLLLKPDRENSVVIRDRCFLGRELMYYLRTSSGKELIARTTSQQILPVGTHVKVAIANDAIRAFPVA